MSKRSQRRRKPVASEESAAQVDCGDISPPRVDPDGVSATAFDVTWPKRLCVLFALLHLSAIALSMASAVGTSTLQASLVGWADLYLRPMHFSVDDAPVFLASGMPTDQTLRLEVQANQRSDPVSLPPAFTPGMAADDRQQRYLASIVVLAEAGQDSLAAELLLPVIKDQVASGDKVTLRREPTLLTNALQDQARPPYEARVIETSRGLQLLRIQPDEQLATALEKQP
ncbi:MAG: hypothetical protein AAGD07_15840 [Planctomycetota bacterium]